MDIGEYVFFGDMLCQIIDDYNGYYWIRECFNGGQMGATIAVGEDEITPAKTDEITVYFGEDEDNE